MQINVIDKNIIFEYKNLISQQNIAKFGDILKLRLQELYFTKKTIRNVFATFIELSQNILHYYNESFKLESSDFLSSFACYKKDNEIYLIATNTILGKDITALGKKCDYINSLNCEKLEFYYDMVLEKDMLNAKTAGLGLIEMSVI